MTDKVTIETDRQLANIQAVLPELPWSLIEFQDYTNLDLQELGNIYDNEFKKIGPAKNRTKKLAFDGLTIALEKDEDVFHPFGSRYGQTTLSKTLTLTRENDGLTQDLIFNRLAYRDSVTDTVSHIVETRVTKKVKVETDTSLGALVGLAVKLKPVTATNNKEKYMKDTKKDKKVFGIGVNILRLLNEYDKA